MECRTLEWGGAAARHDRGRSGGDARAFCSDVFGTRRESSTTRDDERAGGSSWKVCKMMEVHPSKFS